MKVRDNRLDARREQSPATALTGRDPLCRIIATSDDEIELDRSRPVPWDWPEPEVTGLT
ncbi:MAG: hypothetical protein ACREFQ_03285 [Stellaceae bacterium]